MLSRSRVDGSAREPDPGSPITANVLTGYLRQLVSAGAFLVVTPLFARNLGTEAFGLWALIQAAVSLFGFLDMGFATSVVKFVAEARGRGDESRLRELTATFFWLYLGLALGVVALTLATAPLVSGLLHVPADQLEPARLVFVLIAFRSALALPMGMFLGVLTGFQRQYWSNAIHVIGVVFYSGLSIWCLTQRPSIEILAGVSLATGVLMLSGAIVVCLRICTGISLRPRDFRVRLLRESASLSVYLLLIQVTGFAYTRLDTLIVTQFLQLSAVAYYALAARIAAELTLLCRQFTNALTPVIAELQGTGQRGRIREIFQTGSKFSMAIATPLLIGLVWFADDVLAAWVGEGFRSATLSLRILLIAALGGVLHGNAANVLAMTGHHRFLSRTFVASQVVNVALTLVLVTRMGIVGVAAATLVSQLVFDVAGVQRRVSRCYGLSMAGYYRKILGPCVLSVVPMLAILWLADRWFQPTTLLEIACGELLACAVFGATFVAVGLDSQERSRYLGRAFAAFASRIEWSQGTAD